MIKIKKFMFTFALFFLVRVLGILPEETNDITKFLKWKNELVLPVL